MRLLQLPLWLAIAFGLAIYLSSVDKNLSAALIFASAFGAVYGGGMAMLKKPSALGKSARRSLAQTHVLSYSKAFFDQNR